MSKHRPLALLILAMLVGCKEGDVDLHFGDAATSKDSGAAGHDAGHQPPDASTLGADAGDAGGADDAGSDAAALDGGGGVEPSLAQLPDQLASATCEALAECVGHPALLAELLGGRDCAEVNAGALRNGELSYLERSIDAGLIVFDATQVEACSSDLRAQGCDARSRRWPGSCELMLLGTVAEGSECSLDQDCAGEAFCNSDAACPGTCSALLAEGEPCSNSDDDQCQDGLVCVGATDTCAALAKSGDPCGSGMPACAPGFACFDGGSGAQCQSLGVLYFRALDEACTPGDGNCAGGVLLCGDVELCEPGLVCQSASSGGICRPPTSKAGGDCKRAVPNQCPLEQVCDAMGAGQLGKCVDRPGDGMACIAREPRCGPGNVCVADTCVALEDNGAVCEANAQCFSGACGTDGSCEGPAVCDVP